MRFVVFLIGFIWLGLSAPLRADGLIAVEGNLTSCDAGVTAPAFSVNPLAVWARVHGAVMDVIELKSKNGATHRLHFIVPRVETFSSYIEKFGKHLGFVGTRDFLEFPHPNQGQPDVASSHFSVRVGLDEYHRLKPHPEKAPHGFWTSRFDARVGSYLALPNEMVSDTIFPMTLAQAVVMKSYYEYRLNGKVEIDGQEIKQECSLRGTSVIEPDGVLAEDCMGFAFSPTLPQWWPLIPELAQTVANLGLQLDIPGGDGTGPLDPEQVVRQKNGFLFNPKALGTLVWGRDLFDNKALRAEYYRFMLKRYFVYSTLDLVRSKDPAKDGVQILETTVPY